MLVRTSFVVLGKKSFLTDLSIDDRGNFSLCIFIKQQEAFCLYVCGSLVVS